MFTVDVQGAYEILSSLPGPVHLELPRKGEKLSSQQRNIFDTVTKLVELYPSRINDLKNEISLAWSKKPPSGRDKRLYDLSQRLLDGLQHYKSRYPPEITVKAERRDEDDDEGGDDAMEITHDEFEHTRRTHGHGSRDSFSPSKRSRLFTPSTPSKRRPFSTSTSLQSTSSSSLFTLVDSPSDVATEGDTMGVAESLESIHMSSPSRPPPVPFGISSNPSSGSTTGSNLGHLLVSTPIVTVNTTPNSSPPSEDEVDKSIEVVEGDNTTSIPSGPIAPQIPEPFSELQEPFVASSKTSRYRQAPPKSEQWVDIVPRNRYHDLLRRVPFGIQWELERLIQNDVVISWTDVLVEDLQPLLGKSASEAGPEIVRVLSLVRNRKIPQASTSSSKSDQEALWRQMDREELALKDPSLPAVVGDQGWYGGRIVYTVAILKATDDEPGVCLNFRPGDIGMESGKEKRSKYRLELRPVEMPGKSSRLARRLGSRKILIFKFGSDITKKGLKKGLLTLFDFLVGRRFGLFGKVFRALWAKPDTKSIFAVQVAGDEGDRSFLELLEGYNSLNLKKSQAVAKWAARPQLLFSDSIPATSVSPARVKVIPDIVVEGVKGKANAEQTLTDGCGLMSQALADQIYRHPEVSLTAKRPPSTVQMRFGGSKGLLALMSPAQALQFADYDIVLRDSMVKSISASEFSNDPSLLTLDLLQVGKIKVGCALSSEPMIILNHGGVPDEVFVELFNDGLDEIKHAFIAIPQEGEDVSEVQQRIAESCRTYGGGRQAEVKRRCRDREQSMRMAGFGQNFKDDAKPDLNCDEEPVESAAAHPVSGTPTNRAHCIERAISSGFMPKESHFISKKLRLMVKDLADRRVREFKIDIPLSARAFIVPDSQGLLAADEISVFFSVPPLALPMPWLEGDVLVYRSPCKLPTDVRKMRAVYRPELFHLKDCIVMSADANQCMRSPASFLGGGDYDGDEVVVVWDPRLIEPFRNAPDHFAETELNFESANFLKDVTSGDELIAELQGKDEESVIATLQTFLLGSILDDGIVGIYSEFHGNAVYKFGLDHAISIRLARMFCLVLDARKSGLSIIPQVRRNDMQYRGRLLWRDFKNKTEQDANEKDIPHVSRHLGKFLMDKIMEHGQAKLGQLLLFFPEDKLYTKPNDGMLSAFKEVESVMEDDPIMTPQRDLVIRHVRVVKVLWGHINASRFPFSRTVAAEYVRLMRSETDGHGADEGGDWRRHDKVLPAQRAHLMSQLATVWAGNPPPHQVPWLDLAGSLRRIKVSTAFAEVAYTKDDRFIFEVDFATATQMRSDLVQGRTISIASNVYS